jgi:hypothetical protein
LTETIIQISHHVCRRCICGTISCVQRSLVMVWMTTSTDLHTWAIRLFTGIESMSWLSGALTLISGNRKIYLVETFGTIFCTIGWAAAFVVVATIVRLV